MSPNYNLSQFIFLLSFDKCRLKYLKNMRFVYGLLVNDLDTICYFETDVYEEKASSIFPD